MNDTEDLETLWDQLLSRQPDQVLKAFAALSESEQQAVLSHLRNMAEEDGWHPEQRISAQAALKALAVNP